MRQKSMQNDLQILIKQLSLQERDRRPVSASLHRAIGRSVADFAGTQQTNWQRATMERDYFLNFFELFEQSSSMIINANQIYRIHSEHLHSQDKKTNLWLKLQPLHGRRADLRVWQPGDELATAHNSSWINQSAMNFKFFPCSEEKLIPTNWLIEKAWKDDWKVEAARLKPFGESHPSADWVAARIYGF